MTQFIVVTRGVDELTPPKGLAVRQLDAKSARLVGQVFPGYRGPCSQVIDPTSGEADALLDALHNQPDGEVGELLLLWLEAVAKGGAGIAFWYASDTEDLPSHQNWESFAASVRQEASAQPPEVYAVMERSG